MVIDVRLLMPNAQISYTITCQQDDGLVWIHTLKDFSCLVNFILESAKHRTCDEELSTGTIVISKAYTNFSFHNLELESYSINNLNEIRTLAKLYSSPTGENNGDTFN